MKAAIREQWIKDLRSGDFEQGNHYLERVTSDGTHRLCCLGVLCRQAVAAGVIPPPELHDGEYRYLDDGHDEGGPAGESFNQPCSLPRKVSEWAGVNPEDGDIALGPEQDEWSLTAIAANDFKGLNFAQIADLVEQNVPAE